MRKLSQNEMGTQAFILYISSEFYGLGPTCHWGIRETGQVQEIGKAMEIKALRFTEYQQLASYMQWQSLLFEEATIGYGLFSSSSLLRRWFIYLFIIYLPI